jgi:anaerobic magnesium-protoporphyrin IX monomethyl ester cyclase
MAHVCLINPPGIKTTSGLQMHTPNPPIGLAYIASACRAAGHRVTVIDATGAALDQIAPMRTRPDILVQGLTREQVVARIPADVDVVGLGCMFSTLWPISREILEAIRAARPELTIIAGGEHVSAVPEHVLATSPVDICVVGEGEETIVELLDALTAGTDLSTVPGLVYRKPACTPDDATETRDVSTPAFGGTGEPVHTPPRRRAKNVDLIPPPAWELFPVEAYIERRQMNGIHQGRAMPILGTRGCPFRCTFCSSPQMWSTAYAMRDVRAVCDEIETYMERYGATDFHFQDLTAIVSKKWILAFCDELIARGLKITWQLPSGTRSEAIDREVCERLAQTGCKNMAYAPESGSEAIRQQIHKRVKLESLLESIDAALASGLTLSCFFVIGFPQDTPETLRESLALVRRLAWKGVQDVGVAQFIPYPGSVLFKELVAAGRITLDDAFFLSPIDSYSTHGQVSYCEKLDTPELRRWMVRLYLNFYLISFARHPLRTLRTLARVFTSGVEETRYAKWFRDFFRTRRQWRRAAAARPSTPVAQPATRDIAQDATPDVLDLILSSSPHANSCASRTSSPAQRTELTTGVSS